MFKQIKSCVYASCGSGSILSKDFSCLIMLILQCSPKYKSVIKLDGANGVGAVKVKKILEYMKNSAACQWLDIEVYNDGSTGSLNENVNSVLTMYFCSSFLTFTHNSVVLTMSSPNKLPPVD